MDDSLEKTMRIDDRLESYGRFYDHAWAKELTRIASAATKLDEILFDLNITLKGLSNNRTIPSLAVTIAESYSNGAKIGRLSDCMTLQVMNHIAARIEQKLVLSSDQIATVKKVMLDLMEEAYKKVEGLEMPFPKQELWDAMVKVVDGEPKNSPKRELQLALWASQRICYSGLFFAYEDFLVRCISCHTGSPARATDKKFPSLCSNVLGDALANHCWNEPKIVAAKAVRHALAHAGGRVTHDVSQRQHGLLVEDGCLQILPADVDKLFELLRPRITKLVEWASGQPQFA